MNKSIKKYLQGSLGGNVLGSIVGIWKKQHINDSIAILFYISQTTGRIERFLINSKSQIDYDTYQFMNQETDVNIKLESKNISFKDLDDGKLDTRFLKIFVSELFMDYLTTKNSYKITDMNYISHYSMQLEKINRVILDTSLSRPTVGMEGTTSFKSDTYDSNINWEKTLRINTPPYLNVQGLNDTYGTRYNVEFERSVITHKSAGILLDFKDVFSARKITDKNTLNEKIYKFNKKSREKLLDMQKIG